MTTFDKRKDAFESKFAHDAELRFKTEARRNKLLGIWAAGEMGKTGPAADTYAREVVASDFIEAGDEDVFRKIRKDFDDARIAHTDAQIRSKMAELMATAMEQVAGEG